MKKYLLKSVVFAIALSFGYALLILIWGLLMPDEFKKNLNYKIGGKGHMFSRIRDVKQTHNVDVLVIGSSLAMRGFDPRMFEQYGYKMFNLASGGQTPVQSEWLVKRYINQLQPKVLIFEVNPYVLSRDGVESALDLFSNHEFEWSFIPMALTVNNIRVYNTLIYSGWCRMLGLNHTFNEAVIKDDDTYIKGGFVEKEMNHINKSTIATKIKYELTPVSYQKKSLLKLVEFVKAKNIPLILVQPPVSKVFFELYRDDESIDSFFSKTGDYQNWNYLINMNDSLHFYDSRHLNQIGVGKFNESFIAKSITPLLN